MEQMTVGMLLDILYKYQKDAPVFVEVKQDDGETSWYNSKESDYRKPGDNGEYDSNGELDTSSCHIRITNCVMS